MATADRHVHNAAAVSISGVQNKFLFRLKILQNFTSGTHERDLSGPNPPTPLAADL
jgi:hypothetical protein